MMSKINLHSRVCPHCAGALVWVLRSREYRATSTVRCSNSSHATRVNFYNDKKKFCTWSGVVMREYDGNVSFFHDDGITSI